MKSIILIFAIFVCTEARRVCPITEAVKDFNIKKYMGKWYEIYRLESSFQAGGDCVKAKYNMKDDGTIGVYNSMVKNGTKIVIEGEANFDQFANGTGKLLVNFPDGANKRNGKYWVISTDYTNYSLVYSCTGLPTDGLLVFSWVLSRTKTLNPQSVLDMNAALEKTGLTWKDFRETSQTETACRVTNRIPYKDFK